jgi:hypothetical protein
MTYNEYRIARRAFMLLCSGVSRELQRGSQFGMLIKDVRRLGPRDHSVWTLLEFTNIYPETDEYLEETLKRLKTRFKHS